MRSEYIVLSIMAVSTALSVMYLLYAIMRRSLRLAINGTIMLFTPLVGPLFYAGGFIAEKIRRHAKKVQEEDVGFSKERHGRLVAPDMDYEMQTVPIEEVLIVSQDSEKRKYLLRELKKDEVGSYAMLVKALDNDDPETAHYAASAISSAKAEFENNVRKLDYTYLHDGGAKDMEFIRSYTDYLLKFLRSGILGNMEIRKYSYAYVNIFSKVEQPEEILTSADYMHIVHELIKLGEFSQAVDWAKRAFEARQDESSYMLLAKVYYYTGRLDSLNDTIARLKASDIPLSSEGLDFIRFFMSNQKAAPAAAKAEPAVPAAAPAAAKAEPLQPERPAVAVVKLEPVQPERPAVAVVKLEPVQPERPAVAVVKVEPVQPERPAAAAQTARPAVAVVKLEPLKTAVQDASAYSLELVTKDSCEPVAETAGAAATADFETAKTAACIA